VPRADAPEWELRSIRGRAYQRDLYTSVVEGEEVDELERWIKRNFEDPGLEAINQLVNGTRMTPTEWRSIARFVAAQDVRTPLSFIELMRLFEKEGPAILDECVRDFAQSRQRPRTDGDAIERNPYIHPFGESLRVRLEKMGKPNAEKARVSVEVSTPRKLWLASIRQILTNSADKLCQQRWSVAKPYGEEDWPTTDHPVIRLNYYARENYDFAGGWEKPGSELFMPISPKHLVCAQVGRRIQNRLDCTIEGTKMLQHLIVERAHRWVFARRPELWVARVKPRVIDQAAFEAEKNIWKNWPEQQLKAEQPSPKS